MPRALSVLVSAFILLASGLFSARADDFGNTWQTAHPLTLGVPVNGNHETPGDVDFFKFNAVVNHLYTAKITNLVGLSDTVLRLWSSDGLSILVEKDEIGMGETIVWRAPSTATYYLSVHQYFEDQTGTYTLTVSDGGVVVDDHGDSPETATLIPTDGSLTAGDIDFAGDVDYFAFSAESGRFYRIETLLLEPGVDTVLRLFASDGVTELAEDDQGGRELNASRLIFGASLSGIYFAEVSLFFPDDVGGYAVSATDEGVPGEIIVDGSPVAGRLSTRDDIDLHRFAGGAGDRLRISCSSDNLGNNFQMILLGPDKRTRVLAHDFASAPETTWLCPADAEFYLVLEEPFQGGAYSLRIENLGPPPPPVDINGDGVVDMLDLLLLSLFWRQSTQ